MSNTNVPPSNNRRNELLEIQNRLTTNLNRSLLSLQRKFEGFINPLNRFTDSISRLDRTNIEALKIGTTNAKLSEAVSKNSTILNGLRTSNQELQEAIIQGFGQGVRVQTAALTELTTEMVATKQNVGALNKLNSDLVLFTGNNIQSIDNAARVNKEVSDAYGVSNDKLINTLNGLRETLQTASFFGTNAVDSLAEVSKQLQGRAAGTDVTGALRTLNRLLVGGLETERLGAMLGATAAREKIAAGGRLDLQRDIIPILDQLEARRQSMGGGRFGLDILAQSLGESKQSVVELLNLRRIAKQDFKLNEELKKTTDETYNSIENINKRALNFYDNTAMGILGGIGSLNTNVIFLGTTMTQLAGGIASLTGGVGGAIAAMPGGPGRQSGMHNLFARTGLNRIPGFSLGSIRQAGGGRGLLKRGLGGLGLTAAAMPLVDSALENAGLSEALGATARGGMLGASLGSFIPGLGTLVGGLIGAGGGLVVDGFQAMIGSSKAEEEQLEIMKEERRERRAAQAAAEVESMRVITGFVRSRMSLNPSETSERYLELLLKSQMRMERKMEDSKTSVTR